MEHYLWGVVKGAVGSAKAITWDGCHKIYVLMDDQQVQQSEDWGYDPIIRVADTEEAVNTLKQWFDESCGLRFINAVSTVESNPNEGYKSLIGQFDFDDEE